MKYKPDNVASLSNEYELKQACKQFRIIGGLLLVLGFGIVAAAIVVSKLNNLIPCPLCIFQRIVFLILGIIGFIILIYPPINLIARKLWVTLILLVSAIGAGIGSWQVYLQNAPPKISCGPELDYMLNNWSIAKWLPAIFSGGGDCARIDWLFLGLSMPHWSAMAFYIVILCALFYLFSQKK